MKVMTIVGTRPEIIRLSEVIRRLDSTPGIEHVLVHTGQNWDPQLRDVFFDELELRAPDHDLTIDTSSLGASIGDIIAKSEVVMLDEKPDAVLVLGDTNSALSLIMAKRLGITTFHMEAGNRCWDVRVPEETNRRIVDHTADYNLAYTEHARRNLLAEGIHPRTVIVTGSPMNEVLARHRSRIEENPILDELGLRPRGYFLVSAHREETVDNEERLSSLIESLSAVAAKWNLPVIVSTHPRTRRRLELFGDQHIDERIRFLEPFGFLAYNKLQLEAACVLSDSGTISEESTLLGFPAVTLRSAIERPEALDTGSITLVDVGADDVIRGVEFAMARSGPSVVPGDYAIGNTSERVLNWMLSVRNSAGSHFRAGTPSA